MSETTVQQAQPAEMPAATTAIPLMSDAVQHTELPSAIASGDSAETDDLVRQALRARARQFSREPEAEEDTGEMLQVVEFQLAQERFAVESHYVREVSPLKTLTPLPCVPSFVAGLTNVRGEIMSVVDLKKLFGLAEQEITDFTRVIILHSDEMTFGILADAVVGALQFPAASLQSDLPTLTDIRARYLHGVTADRLAVLDAVRILGDPDLVVHDEL